MNQETVTALGVVLAAFAASYSLNAVFLRRLLQKVDSLYDAYCGTPTTPGLRDDVEAIKRHIGLSDEPFTGRERRMNERRQGR